MDYPQPVQDLIGQIAKLPGIGKRSAERIALHLLKAGPEAGKQLAAANRACVCWFGRLVWDA